MFAAALAKMLAEERAQAGGERPEGSADMIRSQVDRFSNHHNETRADQSYKTTKGEDSTSTHPVTPQYINAQIDAMTPFRDIHHATAVFNSHKYHHASLQRQLVRFLPADGNREMTDLSPEQLSVVAKSLEIDIKVHQSMTHLYGLLKHDENILDALEKEVERRGVFGDGDLKRVKDVLWHFRSRVSNTKFVIEVWIEHCERVD